MERADADEDEAAPAADAPAAEEAGGEPAADAPAKAPAPLKEMLPALWRGSYGLFLVRLARCVPQSRIRAPNPLLARPQATHPFFAAPALAYASVYPAFKRGLDPLDIPLLGGGQDPVDHPVTDD